MIQLVQQGEVSPTKVAVVGCGNVTSKRVQPALRVLQTQGHVRDVLYVDQHNSSPLPINRNGYGEDYVRLNKKFGLVDVLDRHKFVGPDVLMLNCTPTPFHGQYAREAIDLVGRIGVEKPLTMDVDEARNLQQHSAQIHPLGHQVYKREMIDLIERFERQKNQIEQISQIEFDLFESVGVGGRAIDSAIWDLGWHGFECILASLKSQNSQATFEIHRAQEGRYEDGFTTAFQSTVAKLDGVVLVGEYRIPFHICVGKGQPETTKAIRFRGNNGRILDQASLTESGYQAHERMIRKLIQPGQVDMRLKFNDIVHIVECCQKATTMSEVMGVHEFGLRPVWLDHHFTTPTRSLN